MEEQKLILGHSQPKQHEFMVATERYVAFGGARGGGKSWAVREKAKRMALAYPGIKILIIRQTYVDLRDNHILPLQKEIPEAVAKYKELDKSFVFVNGSRIKCSFFATDSDAMKYQGQEFDIIFLEEATQFSENVFDVLKACNRGANTFPKRIYLTCNPDGVGFLWVKRLFVSREYRENENPNDYRFIQSLVDDNQALLKLDPGYIARLDALPEEMRRRWRYGSWDVAEGQYFPEFERKDHVIQPIHIDDNWRKYISIDYGLDRLAVLWHAVTDEGRIYTYREYCESNLTISEASEKIKEYTSDDKHVWGILAPPDLWGRSQETGKSKAELFFENGCELTKSNNDREAGWLSIKELLKIQTDGKPKWQCFDTCRELIHCLPNLLRDKKHPTDTANEPHEITHAPDSLRYFAIYWISPRKDVTETYVEYRKDWLEDLYNARSEEERERIYKKYGGKPK